MIKKKSNAFLLISVLIVNRIFSVRVSEDFEDNNVALVII